MSTLPAAAGDQDPELPPPGTPALSLAALVAVTFGGVAGALARYGLGVAAPTTAGTFPLTTLLINISGAFLLGALVGVLTRQPARSPLWRLAVGTGVLGGYTTFSTFAVDGDRLLSTGHPGLAVGYLAATLVGGLLATGAGLLLAGRR